MKICVLAFSEPPAHWGFRLSRKGTSWFIHLEPDRVTRCLAALKERGIDAKVLQRSTHQNPSPSPSTIKGKRHAERRRGKTARTAYAADQQRHRDQRYIEHAAARSAAIAEAARIEDIKRKRAEREKPKRDRERQRAAQHTRDREAQARVDLIHGEFLMRHPAGSA